MHLLRSQSLPRHREKTPTRKSINQPLALVFNQLLVPFKAQGASIPGVWPKRSARKRDALPPVHSRVPPGCQSQVDGDVDRNHVCHRFVVGNDAPQDPFACLWDTGTQSPTSGWVEI